MYFPQETEYVRRCKQLDGRVKRIEAFKKCLSALLNASEMQKYKKILFPYKIGCAVAGGNWGEYEKAIQDFSMKIKKQVYIVNKY